MLPGKGITPAMVKQVLRRRLWLVVIPPVITLFTALLYSSRVPNLYQAEMLIAVDPQGVPESFVRSTVTLRTDRRIEALKLRVLSRTTLEKLIKQFDLYQVERSTMPLEDVVAKMRSKVDVIPQIPRPRWGEEPQPTGFRVLFTHGDPQVAAQLTQRLGALFVDSNVRDRGAMANATNQFLENQLAESRRKLEAHEQKLEQFRQRHGRELPTQMGSNLQALTTAQMRVQSLVESTARDRDRKLMVESLYRQAAAERPAPVVAQAGDTGGNAGQVQSSATYAQQLAAARTTLANLELRYTSDHPDVGRARRVIAELEPKAAAEAAAAAAPPTGAPDLSDVNAQVSPARRESQRQMLAEIESLTRQITFKESEERKVRAEIAEYQRRVEAVPGLESEWVALTRDYDTQQTAYRELLQKSTAARLAANLEAEDIGERFRIVDAAFVPVKPLASMRLRYNAIGLAIGLFLGLGVAALLELKDKSFRTEADVFDVLRLPVLVTVYRIDSSADKARRARRRQIVSVSTAACVLVGGYVVWALKLWDSLI